MNVVFTGMRGTGKSVLGQAVAEKLGWDFVDMDPMIEMREGRSIREIVNESGWEQFRRLERELAQELGLRDNLVISTGGGTFMFEENVQALKRKAKVVLLKCDLGVSSLRILGDYNRPSLFGKKSSVSELGDVWDQRKDKYLAVADFVYETDNGKSKEDQVADIVKFL